MWKESAGFDEGVVHANAEFPAVTASAGLLGRSKCPIDVEADLGHVAVAKLCNGERDLAEENPLPFDGKRFNGGLADRHGHLLRFVGEQVRTAVVLEIKKDVSTWILEAQQRQLLGPLPFSR